MDAFLVCFLIEREREYPPTTIAPRAFLLPPEWSLHGLYRTDDLIFPFLNAENEKKKKKEKEKEKKKVRTETE
jgi:hypothetical protein